jgi:hypothetical protein
MSKAQDDTTGPSSGDGIFRREALEHYLASRGEGEVLRISPSWTRWAYYALVAMVSAGLLIAVLARIDEHATGPAVIEMVGATDAGEPKFEVVVMLPGQHLPRLEPGARILLELTGYSQTPVELTASRVSDEVLHPSVVRGQLRTKMAEAIAIDGPVALVWGLLEGPSFSVRGAEYPYVDGQFARAEVRIGSSPALVSLVPGLKPLLEILHGR